MSYVQNIILTGSLGTVDDRLDKINVFIKSLPAVRNSIGLRLLNKNEESYGGSKALELDVAVGAFNYLPLKEFIAGLKEIFADTDDFDVVQLIYNDQNDTGVRLLTIFGEPDVEDQS